MRFFTRWVMGMLYTKPDALSADFEAQLRRRGHPAEAPVPASLRAECEMEVSPGPLDQSVVTLRPRSGASGFHVIYLHGGGYVFPIHKFQWANVRQFLHLTRATVTTPLYALAPAHNFAPALDFIVDHIRSLLAAGLSPSKLILAGDSAGGNFVASLLLRFPSLGIPQPAHAFLFSPWMNMTGDDEQEAKLVEASDPMLSLEFGAVSARLWAGDESKRAHPFFSPVNAPDLSGLAPITIFQGTNDICVVSARRFAANAPTRGGQVSYFEYTGAFHTFMTAVRLPESKDVWARVAHTVNSLRA
jgi:acetyl esterase/lipase